MIKTSIFLYFLFLSPTYAQVLSPYNDSIEQLKNLHGKFEPLAGNGIPYRLAGLDLSKNLDSQGIKVIPSLIDCISRTDLSKSKLGEKPVSVGILCWYVLRTMTYFECSDKNGNVVSCKDIPTEFDPKANGQKLKKVQESWRKELLLKEKRFNLT